MLNKLKNFNIKKFLLMNLGILCCALATVLFITPSKIVVGGATGLAVLLQLVTNVHYYYYLYGINITLIIISFFTLKKEFTLKTIYGSIMLPTYGALLSLIFNACGLTDDKIFELVCGVEPIFIVLFAAILMGFGIGINMKSGGSTGGFDILESIGLKYFHIPYSTSMYSLDALLVISGMIFYKPGEQFVFANGLSEGLGAIIYVFLDGFVVDTITFGGYNKRAVFIRSSKYEEIHDAIINKLIRGMTYVDAQGGYSLTPTKMIVCICYSREYFILRDLVQKIDPNAFMFVTKATEVRGLGFNYETPEHIARRKKLQQNKKD